MNFSQHDSSLDALELVVDMADTPLVITDAKERFVFANRHTLDIVGKTRDACMGKPLSSLLSVSRRPRFNKSSKTPVLFTREGHFYEVDGISRIRTGTRTLTLSRIHDVTSTYRDKEMLEFLKNDAPIGIFQFVMDEYLSFSYASEGFCVMHGYTLEQMRDELHNRGCNLIHPDQLQRVVELIRAAYEGGKTSVGFEMKVIRRDGKIRWFLTKCSFVETVDGTIVYGYVSDCTDLKDMEQKTKSIQDICRFTVNHDYEWILLVDTVADRYEYFFSGRNSMNGSGMTGVFSELIQIRSETIVHPEDAEAYRAFFEPGRLVWENSTPGLSHEFKYRLIVRGGQVRWHCLRAYLFDPVRRVILFCVKDIEEEEQQKDTLRVALAAAEEANHAKSDFLSRMSHDIRTPMNAIIGMTTIAGMNIGNPERLNECLSNIALSSRFLLSLINDVLDVAKIESGKMSLASEPFDFVELVDSVSLFTYGGAAEKGIEFSLSVAPLLEKTYVGDPLRIKQVLMNLLSNALKFAPEKGRIELGITPFQRVGHREIVRFAISDNGIGMSKVFQEKMFQPFEQEMTDQRGLSGSGLGLAIVRNLVQLMDGAIRVESEQGKGTSFLVDIPLGLFEGPAHERDTASERFNGNRPLDEDDRQGVLLKATSRQALGLSAVPEEVSFDHEKILIAEDNELNAEILKTLLEYRNLSVVWAENGKAAMERFAESEPGEYAAILMDIRMPIMDGLEATRQIRGMAREDARRIPIFALSANAFVDDIQRSLQCGMNAHFNKPVDMDSICATLYQWLRPGKEQRP